MSVDPTALVVMFLTFLAGSHGDLLDSISTEQYWHVRHMEVTTEQLRQDASAQPAVANIDRLLHDLASDDFRTRVKSREALAGMGPGIIEKLQPALRSKDPEVSETVSGLIADLSKQTHQRDVERLMAIRTLGERKDAASVAMLEKMEGEKDLFVAEYARRAVAEIQGKPWSWPDPHAAVEGEAWLLPADTAIVLQGTQAGWEGLTADRLAALAREESADTEPADAALAQPEGTPAGPAAPAASASERVAANLVRLADRLGDMRIDGMTIGISKEFDGDTGWFVAVMHGRYDPVTVRQVLGYAAAAQGRIATKIDGVDAIALDEGYLLMPSPTEMAILYDDDGTTRLPHAREMVAALKAGKGALAEGGELGKMVQGVRDGAVAWGASIGNDAMHKAPMFAAFPQMTLRAVRNGQKLDFTISSDAGDADAAKLGRDSLMQQVKAATADWESEISNGDAQGVSLDPVAAMFRSIKVDLQGTRMTMTGSVPGEMSGTMMQATEVIGGLMPDVEEGTGGAATQP